MKKKIVIPAALLACFLILPGASRAGKPARLPDLLAEANRSALAAASGRKIRLAVMPLKATGSPRYADRGCAAFLTESLFSSLASAGPKIRLFERTLLDSVLKEQALAAGGLLDKSEAVRIGELAPIDYILTGTISRLEGSVAVHLRLIDVVTGEISANISSGLELTPDIAALFEDIPAARSGGGLAREDREPDCEGAWAPVKKLMADVGTPERVARLGAAASAVPFEGACGAVHFEVMDLLGRHKLAAPAYDAFLLEAQRKIAEPGDDRRALAIAAFLLDRPGPAAGAWEEALRAAATSARFYRWLELLVYGYDGSPASLKELRRREGVILSLADKKELGRPVRLGGGEVFLGLLKALSSVYLDPYGKKDPLPLFDAYEAYGGKYAGAAGGGLLAVLRNMRAAAAGGDRVKALGWFCARLGALPPSRETADEAVDLLRPLFDARREALKKSGRGGEAEAELERLAGPCGPPVAAQIPFIVGREYRLDVTAFCLEHGIGGSAVPAPGELAVRLASADDAEKREAVRLLKALGPAARPAEGAAAKLLSRTEDRYLQRDLIGLLGGLRPADPAVHRLLIEHLLGQESYLSEEAAPALAAIGEPAAAALKAEFAKIEESYRKVAVLKVFQLRGAGAAKDLPWLRSVLAAAPDKYVKHAAEDAVEAASK